jgi:hypothetical protein
MKNKKMNGTTIIFFCSREDEKYFLKREIYKIIKKIQLTIKKPNNPVSVKISK